MCSPFSCIDKKMKYKRYINGAQQRALFTSAKDIEHIFNKKTGQPVQKIINE